MDFLNIINQPGRYLGGEAGSVRKENPSLTLALAFPEIYELAMSHQGLKVLYDLAARRPDVAGERVFAPYTDLMDIMYQRGLGPWSLESGRPLRQFDVIGFSLPYEMLYTNMLHMLRLASIPLRRQDRGPDHPLIMAGGPCMANPEPIADFLDLAYIGEAENHFDELMDLFLEAKREKWPRSFLYQQAGRLSYLYVPALYEPRYDQDGRFLGMRGTALWEDKTAPSAGGASGEETASLPLPRRSIVPDLNMAPLPAVHIVPAISPVHDRLGLEIARGCTRGCRFCQAGYIYRPLRERDPLPLYQAALEGLRAGGMDELALLSLSSGDYSCIGSLSRGLMDALSPAKISLSLPSLRVDSLSAQLMEQIKRVRKTGFTLAPEAGSERLRALINKNLCQEDIIATAARAFALGWEHIKLYFMIGLPEETDEDIKAIAGLCAQIAARAPSPSRGGKALVNASIGLFVPKAQTPFQWERQMDPEEARRRMRLAKAGVTHKRVKVKWNDPDVSIIEGVLSRGDRRLSLALEEAVALGCRFDGWSEHFRLQAWLEALDRAGLKWEEYLCSRPLSGPLPWDHISMGVSREYLLRERRLAYNYEQSQDCRQGGCSFCGVCDGREIKTRLVPENSRLPSFPFSAPGQKQSPEGAPVSYRLLFSKTGPARFTGHLELISQITRALRRSGLDLAHSAGFHPHPLIKTASALPLGVESMGEEMEIVLKKACHPSQLPDLVNQNLPQGLAVISARLTRPGEILREAEQVEYWISGAGDLDPLRLEHFQAADCVTCLRQSPKGDKIIDLKTSLLNLQLEAGGLRMIIKSEGTRPRAAEVLETVFGLNREQAAGARVIKQRSGGGPEKI
ncbi:MAG: TIGR03960 family B12-binding radical SAM protein [Desulfarculales bacterium]|jgi:radical SAM family uncharacterized protein/radical SAM-linked protein|nr:TIGR03960 family B12-binding radical SAM protein [Desulfarculales bacterium]